MRLIGLFVLGLLLPYVAFADSQLITSSHFSTVEQLLLKDKHPKHTLLALDDDDTLTMMPCPSAKHCQYIGGPAWYSWQAHLSKNSPMRVQKSFAGLLNVNGLLLSLSRMPATEKDIPSILRLAQKRGVRIVVATARGRSMLSATERQLKQDHMFNTIEKAAIKTPNGHISFAGPYMPKDGQRPIEYQNGILYLAGQNKGTMLRDFLHQTHETHKITRIIFVDDTLKNDQDVTKAYQHTSNVRVTSMWYTHLEKHKAQFLYGKKAKKLQSIANSRWQHIAYTLKHNLPALDLS